MQVFTKDGALKQSGGSGGGSGTVTSVALTVPAELSVTGSPVTTAGTLAISKATQVQNTIYSGPTTGAAAQPTFRTLVSADYPVFIGSGTTAAVGAVPTPGTTAGTTMFLREDATFAVPPGTGVTSVTGTTPIASSGGLTPAISIATFVASGVSAARGAVPAPSTTSGTTMFLREDATFAVPPGTGVTSVTGTSPIASSGGLTPAISIATFVASGVSAARGAVPAPSTTAGTTKYLREDATFAVPPGTGVTSVTGTLPISSSGGLTPDISVATFVASGGSAARGVVPSPGTTSGTTKFLREDATFVAAVTSVTGTSPIASSGGVTPAISISNFIASGGSAAAGAVPSPGTTSGTTKFLREDATFVAAVTSVTGTVPIVSSGGVTPAISINTFVASGVSAAKGAVPIPSTTAGTTLFLREDATWATPAGGTSIAPLGASAYNMKNYVNATNPNYQVDVTANQIVLLDSSNTARSVFTFSNTVDITASGVNGLDTGAEASSTWYYIWAISNGTLDKGLLSVSSTAPTMPSGYTYKALIGVVRNDGSSNFIPFYQMNKVIRTAPIVDFNNLAGTNTVWTSRTCATWVPPIALTAMGIIGCTSANITNAFVAIASDANRLGVTWIGRLTAGATQSAEGFGDAVNFTVLMKTAQTVFWYGLDASAQYRLVYTGYEIP